MHISKKKRINEKPLFYILDMAENTIKKIPIKATEILKFQKNEASLFYRYKSINHI
jgi:hypothetical protein